jgi:hypothetical protein
MMKDELDQMFSIRKIAAIFIPKTTFLLPVNVIFSPVALASNELRPSHFVLLMNCTKFDRNCITAIPSTIILTLQIKSSSITEERFDNSLHPQVYQISETVRDKDELGNGNVIAE